VPGQHRAGQCNDDEVANLEVMGTAHHTARARVVVLITNVHLTPADRLAVGVDLDLVCQHLADHQRAGDIGPDLLDRLNLQPSSDQRLSESPTVKIIRQRGVLAEPAQRRPHRACSCTPRGFKGVVPLAPLIGQSPPKHG
jgi:hypothetical protein